MSDKPSSAELLVWLDSRISGLKREGEVISDGLLVGWQSVDDELTNLIALRRIIAAQPKVQAWIDEVVRRVMDVYWGAISLDARGDRFSDDIPLPLCEKLRAMKAALAGEEK